MKLSKEFETGMAPRLQRYLWLKWLWSDNYVSDWWEEYVYLRGRSPIMINSNYYVIDAILGKSTPVQSARAANNVHSAFCFRRIVAKQETAPLLIQGLIPLCSNQYDRLFNTTRIPGEEGDKLSHLIDSTHIVVLSRGRYYRMGCYSKGRLLEPAEMQSQLQSILNDTTSPDEGEERLAIMTASERTAWARMRREHFSKGVNKASLKTIDTAAFVLVLDDFEYDYEPVRQTHTDRFRDQILSGLLNKLTYTTSRTNLLP